MRKLKEVLRLAFLGLSQHQIARSRSISQSTVHEYLAAAQAAGVQWPLPADWGQIHHELQTHNDPTLQLVWQEARENDSEGYGYSRFCDLCRRWLKKFDLVLRQEHRAGEKMFADYAGATIPIHNPQNGEARPAFVSVAALDTSSYTFAETRTGQDLLRVRFTDLHKWITLHGGSARLNRGRTGSDPDGLVRGMAGEPELRWRTLQRAAASFNSPSRPRTVG